MTPILEYYSISSNRGGQLFNLAEIAAVLWSADDCIVDVTLRNNPTVQRVKCATPEVAKNLYEGIRHSIDRKPAPPLAAKEVPNG